MSDILRKMTSRKFLLAVVGVVIGVAIALGVTVNEIESTLDAIVSIIERLGGILTILGSIGIYNAAEAKVDAARESNIVTLDDIEIVEEGE